MRGREVGRLLAFDAPRCCAIGSADQHSLCAGEIGIGVRKDTRRPANIAIPRQIAMHLARELTKASLKEIGEAWAPFRSVATWYIWRSLDPLPVDY